MNTNKISLPPISDILVNHIPARGYAVPSQLQYPVPPQLQYPVPPHQQYAPLPPLARSSSSGAVNSYYPQKYYDYYAPRTGHSSTSSTSSNTSNAGVTVTRSPLSHNASPAYSNETTPPPYYPQYSQHMQVQYPYPPSLHKAHSSPDMRLDDEDHHMRGNSKRKTRNNLPKETTYILLKWLNDHLNHPYPNSFEKNQLMLSTGLNQQQLSNWFINARRRKIKSLKEQKRLNLV